ncbi:unnamed protein product [Calypogeia fissa]
MKVLQILTLLFFIFLTIAKASSDVNPPNGYVVEGRVKVEGMGSRDVKSKTSDIKVSLDGGQKVTSTRKDGYFLFEGVTAGTHLLEVSAMGYYFSPVRVNVSAKLNGQVRALAVDTGRYYSEPLLVLKPLREDVFYAKREPFSAMAGRYLKSPQGIWIGFMVVAFLILPRPKDWNDAEMEKAQTEMGNQPVPSFSSLLERLQAEPTKLGEKGPTAAKHKQAKRFQRR